MNSSLIKENWRSRGYSFGVFQDPPKQVWANFVHKTDELVVLAEGEIKWRSREKHTDQELEKKYLFLPMLLIL